MQQLYFCHVCGFNLQDEAPWGEDGLDPTFVICDCCGVEYGYEDVTEAGVARYREEWIQSGANWSSPKLRPPNWSLQEQLSNIPSVLPRGIRRNE